MTLVGACTGGHESITHVVRDSAGIQVVENIQPRWREDQVWKISEPVVTIGGDEGAAGQQLHRVVGAVRMSDGTIVVANAGSGELRHYALDGTFIGSTGGLGEGPGDFRALSWLGRTADDTLLAWDRGLSRVTYSSAEGIYVRDYSPNVPDNPMSLVVRGKVHEQELLFSRGADFISAEGEAGVQRQPLTAWLASPTGGEVVRAFGPFPGEQVYLRAGRTPGSVIRTPVPLGTTTLIAAAGEHVYVVDTGGFSIQMYDSDAQLVRLIRRNHDPLNVQPADLAAEIEVRLRPLPPVPEIRAGARASLERVPPVGFIPPVRAMIVDGEEYLWVETGRHAGSAEATWSIFDPSGIWLGDITVPASMQLLDIGSDYVLAHTFDALDVESVHLLALERM